MAPNPFIAGAMHGHAGSCILRQSHCHRKVKSWAIHFTATKAAEYYRRWNYMYHAQAVRGSQLKPPGQICWKGESLDFLLPPRLGMPARTHVMWAGGRWREGTGQGEEKNLHCQWVGALFYHLQPTINTSLIVSQHGLRSRSVQPILLLSSSCIQEDTLNGPAKQQYTGNCQTWEISLTSPLHLAINWSLQVQVCAMPICCVRHSKYWPSLFNLRLPHKGMALTCSSP